MKNNCRTLMLLFAIALTVGPFTVRTEAVGNVTTRTRQPAPQAAMLRSSLDIPGLTLTKGDPKKPVMRELSALYTIQRLRSEQGEEDSWLISEKEEPDNYVGVVSFAAGKVSRVARFRKWTEDDDSVELAERLCELLERLTQERGSQAKILARGTESGKVYIRGVELVFGDKRVSFNIVSRNGTGSKQTEVHLDEVV